MAWFYYSFDFVINSFTRLSERQRTWWQIGLKTKAYSRKSRFCVVCERAIVLWGSKLWNKPCFALKLWYREERPFGIYDRRRSPCNPPRPYSLFLEHGSAAKTLITQANLSFVRHENDHACDVRRETEESPPSFLARRSHARALSIPKQKSKRDCSQSYLSPSFFLWLKSKTVTTEAFLSVQEKRIREQNER